MRWACPPSPGWCGGHGLPASSGPWSSLPSQKNSSQAEDILAAVTRVLGQAPVAFRGAELLAGQDEGAFGWITVNYVLGLLVKVPRAAPGWGLAEQGQAGKASPGTQCPSVVSTPSLESGLGLRRGRWWAPWTWAGPPPRSASCPEARFWTRAQRPPSACTGPSTASTPTATSASGGTRCWPGSWRGWCRSAGTGDGRPQGAVSRQVLKPPPPALQSSRALRVRHPCYHSGYWDTLSPAPLFASPCVQGPAPPDLTQNLTVEGMGNPGACVSAIRNLFNFSSCEGRGDCAFNGVYQPPVQGQFYVSTPTAPPRVGQDQGAPGGSAPRCGVGPAQCRHARLLPPGLLQLLPHLPLPEPHLGAAAGHCQRHCLGLLPAAMEGGKAIPGPLPGLPQASLGCRFTEQGLGDPTLGSVASGAWGATLLHAAAPGSGPRELGPPLTRTCWAQVEATWPAQKPWLRDHCASGLYILTLLLDGYRFTEETWPSIQFRKQVPPPRQGGVGAPRQPACPPDLPCGPQAGGTDIGWTLGYMLNLTGMIPAEAPAQWRAESYGVWAASVVFMVLTLTAVLMAAGAQLFWPQD